MIADFLTEIDTLQMQKMFSFIIGLILGYIYNKVSSKTLIIESNDTLDNIENKSLSGDKCFRYKKVETTCN